MQECFMEAGGFASEDAHLKDLCWINLVALARTTFTQGHDHRRNL